MKLVRYLLSAFTAILLLSSCEDEVKMDLPEGPSLITVDGFLTQENRPHTIFISKTQSYFDDAPATGVSGAHVILTDNTGEVVTLTENPEKPGEYLTITGGETGKTYTLEITLPDDRVIISKPETLNPVSDILGIYYELADLVDVSQEDEDEGRIYRILINTYEPPQPGQYYRWKEYVNGRYQNEPFDLNFTSDELVNGNPIMAFDVTGEFYAMGDTVKIEQFSISEEMYDFLSLVFQQVAFVGSPFDTPPAPIEGNLRYRDSDELILGVFGAGEVKTAEIIIE